MQLDVSCARAVGQSESLASTLGDVGFGMLFVESQCWVRVIPSTLHGAEVIASFSGGGQAAAKRINEVHYRVDKFVLGLRGVSLGSGGHVRALSESCSQT